MSVKRHLYARTWMSWEYDALAVEKGCVSVHIVCLDSTASGMKSSLSIKIDSWNEVQREFHAIRGQPIASLIDQRLSYQLRESKIGWMICRGRRRLLLERLQVNLAQIEGQP